MDDPLGTFEVLRWIVMLSAVIVAAVIDVRTRLIPNWITFPLAISGIFAFTLIGGWGIGGFGSSIGGMLCMGFPYVLVYARGGGGAGDAKLMMGLGTWSGIELGLFFLIGVAVCGLVYTFAISAYRRELKAVAYGTMLEAYQLLKLKKSATVLETTAGGSASPEEKGARKTKGIAYGPVIALGVVVGGVAWLVS